MLLKKIHYLFLEHIKSYSSQCHDDHHCDDTTPTTFFLFLRLGSLWLIILRRLIAWLLIARLILRLLVCGLRLRLLVLRLRLLILGLWLRLNLLWLRLWVRVLPAGQHHLTGRFRGFDHILSRLGLRRLERRSRLLHRLGLDLELRQRLDGLWLDRLLLRLNRLRLGLNRWIGGGGYRLRLSAGRAKPGVVGELGSTIETVFHSL